MASARSVNHTSQFKLTAIILLLITNTEAHRSNYGNVTFYEMEVHNFKIAGYLGTHFCKNKQECAMQCLLQADCCHIELHQLDDGFLSYRLSDPACDPTYRAAYNNVVGYGELVPQDCVELYSAGFVESGLYTIYVDRSGQRQPIAVNCDMETDGGGWMVFQRRQDGSVDFYQNWEAYAKGFGNINGEFWIGNELLHLLTSRKPQQLRVDLVDHEGFSAYAQYDHFYVGSLSAKFAMNISGYTGSAGDDLSYHNSQKFTTLDQDNDRYRSNCARLCFGGWWYKACHRSNLNGLYAQTGNHNMTTYAQYVTWYRWRGFHYSLKFTEMKMRSYNV